MKSRTRSPHQCFDCKASIDSKVFEYSIEKFNTPLCRPCQEDLKSRFEKATVEAKQLYAALRKKGVHAQLEKDTGHMTIDIAITDAMVNIEVDGPHHNYSAKQALADLKRTYHAFKRGYITLRIPNSLIKTNLDETAQYIAEFLKDSKDQLSWV
jgi:very-short-patch-repair endonuclease